MKQKKPSAPLKAPLPGQPPLTDRVAEVLREEIRTRHRPGDRLPTIRQLAERFDVSINTVHHALAVLRREGLVEGWAGSGTYVRERRVDQHVALVCGMGSEHPFLGYYASRRLVETIAVLRRQGIRSRVYYFLPQEHPCSEDESLWTDIRDGSVSAVGVIQFPPVAWQRLQSAGLPVVWSTLREDPDEYCVEIDRRAMAYAGVDALVSAGCRRIAWLDWRVDLPPQTSSHSARIGFRQRMEADGLAIQDGWFGGNVFPTVAGAGYEGFRDVWTAYPEKPDGLLVMDDLLLPDVAMAIQDLGIKVPDRLQVVATANKGAVTCPWFPATRLVVDPVDSAEAMGRFLGALARKEPVTERQVIVPFETVDFRQDASTDSTSSGLVPSGVEGQEAGATVCAQVEPLEPLAKLRCGM